MIDLLLDENRDLRFNDCDLVLGEATEQTIQTILLANPGELKEYPTLGVGIHKIVKKPFDPFFAGSVKQNLKIGNIEIESVKLDTNNNSVEIKIK